jgi:predicted RNA binding protein YcfA (HicA-like mRNA interferase family)
VSSWSDRMRAPKYRRIVRALRRTGFFNDHDTGSHQQWTHPEAPGLVTTKNRPSESPPPDTWKSILKQVEAMGLLERFMKEL